MTSATAVQEKKTAPPKILKQGPVAIKDIVVLEQARKSFPPSKIKELAASIAARGLINPVTLRPHGDKYVLVCGERRLRAHERLEAKEIAARVLDLTAEEAVWFQADENLHREDLTPLEEARGFHALLNAGKRTVPEIASIIKKSEGYVTRATRLLELPKEVLEAIELGSITPAHGHQLLRVQVGQRLEIWFGWKDAYGENGNARSLAEHVEATLGCDLGAASFPKDKPFAGEVACTLCPLNSGNQGSLFDGATKGKCLSKPCFSKKTKQAQADELTHLQKAFPAAMHVVRVQGFVYAGTRLDVGNALQWVARHAFEKRIPRGKFALVLSTATGETWLATPPTDAEQKQEQKAVKQSAAAAPQSPEQQKLEREKREKVEAAIDKAVQGASPKQVEALFEARWKRGWEAKHLKGVKGFHRRILAVAVRGQEFGADELIRALKVKV